MTVAEARDALGLPHDKTICLHAGNMGFKQGLENVVEAARLAVTEAPELSFVLLGDGNQRPHLEQLAHGLPNVRFMDPVPPAMFPNALHAADVLLINQRDTVTDMSLPSKLTSYLTANRPIFAAVHPDSEAARAIEELNGGVVVEPNCSDRLLMALVDNLSSSPQR
jgi:glycosyltransferase involved in cell wall biosynthesis